MCNTAHLQQFCQERIGHWLKPVTWPAGRASRTCQRIVWAQQGGLKGEQRRGNRSVRLFSAISVFLSHWCMTHRCTQSHMAVRHSSAATPKTVNTQKPRAEWRPREIEPDKSVSLTLLVYVWFHTDRPCKDSLVEKLNYRMRKEKKRKKKLQYGTVRLCRNDAP